MTIGTDHIRIRSGGATGARMTAIVVGAQKEIGALALLHQGANASLQSAILRAASYIVEIRSERPLSLVDQAMLASEDVLRRDWDTPEEDAAWANL